MADRVLIVDDDATTRESLATIARKEGWEVLEAGSAEDARTLLNHQAVALVLCDLVMPGIPGTELLRRLRADGHGVPFVLVTGHASVESAVEAMRLGAFDYLSKPVRLRVLRALFAKVRRGGSSASEPDGVSRIEGESPAIQRVREMIELAAPSRSAVLIMGETGTGKELVAEEIHRRSSRSAGPLVKVNCAALPETLIETELFGHERGAFTGADRLRAGRFEVAHGGSLFLDEISELSWAAQARLLRVLQTGEFERVGSSQTCKVDVRLVAATNRDLRELVGEKGFREDLYYRLHVIPIHLPPLRERREDIVILTHAIRARLARESGRSPASISERVWRIFTAYSWPGNVRELEHVLEHAMVLSRGGEIRIEHLPAEIRPERPRTIQISVGTSLEQAEQEIIRRTLEAVNDDKREAARLLGLSRSALYRRLDEIRVDAQPDREAGDGAPPSGSPGTGGPPPGSSSSPP
jgi:DNA-binding NtrC family response regulator